MSFQETHAPSRKFWKKALDARCRRVGPYHGFSTVVFPGLVEDDSGGRVFDLVVHGKRKGPEIDLGYEGFASSSVDKADLYAVSIGDRYDFRPVEFSRFNCLPEVDAKIKIENRRATQAILVSVEKLRPHAVLRAGLHRSQRIAVADAVGEASESFVDTVDRTRVGFREDFLIYSRAGVGLVWTVNVVRVRRVVVQAAVYADKP